MAIAAALNLAILFLFCLLIPVLIGVYVYRDARRRGMNAPLWTLVAVVAPALIGLIIYLLVRGNYSDLQCPRCGASVQPDFVVCPKCGARLRAACRNCSTPVEPDWIVCPKCAEPLSPEARSCTPPIHKADRSLRPILLVVILVPLLLIGLLLLAGLSSGGGSMCSQEWTQEDYFENCELQDKYKEEVRIWLDAAEKDNVNAHALMFEQEDEGSRENTYYTLLFVPGTGGSSEVSFGMNGGIFGTTIEYHTTYTGHSDTLVSLMSTSRRPPRIEPRVNGKKLRCTVEPVLFNPTTIYIDPACPEEVPAAREEIPPYGEPFLPERISIVKIVDNANVGVSVLQDSDRDNALQLLSSIDDAPYLPVEDPIYGKPDGSGGYDFRNGYEIRIEYRTHDDLALHEDLLTCLVFSQDGRYYLIDDRPSSGSFIRSVDKGFYSYLESRFAAREFEPPAEES